MSRIKLNQTDKNTILSPGEINIPSPNRETIPQRYPKRRFKNNNLLFCMRFIIKLFCILIALVLTAGVIYVYPAISDCKDLFAIMDNITRGSYNSIYTEPITIYRGQDLKALHLLERMQDLGYQRRKDNQVDIGQFYVEGGAVYVGVRHSKNQPSKIIRIKLKGHSASGFIDVSSGKLLNSIQLEPYFLTSFVDRVWEIRYPKTFSQFPKILIEAVLATEDQEFFYHPGINFFAIFRAAIANFKAGRIVQGGSTITQQLVKILSHNDARTLTRKYREAILALLLEARYSKQKILTAYLNNVYLGKVPPFEIRGMAAASRILLSKNLEQLNLVDCALLAGLIRSPNSASPIRHPKLAANRARTVISQMAENGNNEAKSTYISSSIQSNPTVFNRQHQAWFISRLEQILTNRHITLDGKQPMDIFVTVDPWLQANAQTILRDHLQLLEQRKDIPQDALEGAIVVLDNYTGNIKAAVGGRNFMKSQFNRAFLAKRQIGSLVKPFIYLSALGGTDINGVINQATTISDTPLRLTIGRKVWTPHDYDNRFMGTITIREALTKSRNIPAVRIGLQQGEKKIARLLKAIGIAPKPPEFPSLFLGAVESTPARMAAGFATIARGGSLVQPRLISRLEFKARVTQPAVDTPKVLLAPGPCYVVTDMLRAVFTNGTAIKEKKLGRTTNAAGKTGTTSEQKDAWFIGYTPKHTVAVWIGRDTPKSMPITGATGALPIWSDLIEAIYGKSQVPEYPIPSDIIFEEICERTGEPTCGFCSRTTTMAFIAGTVPLPKCEETGAKVRKIASSLRDDNSESISINRSTTVQEKAQESSRRDSTPLDREMENNWFLYWLKKETDRLLQ